MKTIALILAFTGALAILGITVFQEQPDIPQKVVDAFWQKYPAAQSVVWEAEGEEFEAEFKLGKLEMSANFARSGAWLETETEIEIDNLPAAVLDGIKTNFPEAELEEAERLERPEQEISFEVELEGTQEDQEIEAVFSSDGQLVSKKITKEKAEAYDD